MDYLSAREIGEKWGISQRRVATLCSECRVPGAKLVGNMWIIPSNVQKPKKPRQVYSDKNKMFPFVKWAGGKRQILGELKSRMPKNFERYYEPFVGGGALFFDLAYNKVTINDINPELIDIYLSLKDDINFYKLIERLDLYEKRHNASKSIEEAKAFFYQTRLIDQELCYDTLPLFEKAARTIYLNKSCFNGLYRVNSNGYFNVPFANKLSVSLYSKENLELIHSYMSTNDIEVLCTSFDKAVSSAKENDFIYFDPPYDDLKKEKGSKSFTSYSKYGFAEKDQIALANLFVELSKKGVYCMLSNHNTEFIRELYSNYNIDVIKANRQINSDASKRGAIEEVIITNYNYITGELL